MKRSPNSPHPACVLFGRNGRWRGFLGFAELYALSLPHTHFRDPRQSSFVRFLFHGPFHWEIKTHQSFGRSPGIKPKLSERTHTGDWSVRGLNLPKASPQTSVCSSRSSDDCRWYRKHEQHQTGLDSLLPKTHVALAARFPQSMMRNRYDVIVPSPMAHLVALHGCRILANMACDGKTARGRVESERVFFLQPTRRSRCTRRNGSEWHQQVISRSCVGCFVPIGQE